MSFTKGLNKCTIFKLINLIGFTAGLRLLFHLATLEGRSDLRIGNQLHSEQVRRLDSITFHFIERSNKYTTMKCFKIFIFFFLQLFWFGGIFFYIYNKLSYSQ